VKTAVAKFMDKDRLRVRESMKTRNARLQWLWDHYIVGKKEPYVIDYCGGRLVVIHKFAGTMEIFECIVERAGLVPQSKR
jgi:hypothetical protein